MPRVVVTPAAAEDLDRLIFTHSLPANTPERVKRLLRPLGDFPLLGQQLGGRWEGFRVILGPWRWMLIVYVFDPEGEQVSIVTIQDGRSARAPRSK
jgi:plasmid stabilization system protein ParE